MARKKRTLTPEEESQKQACVEYGGTYRRTHEKKGKLVESSCAIGSETSKAVAKEIDSMIKKIQENVKTTTREEISKVNSYIASKGKTWVIAAMHFASHGYHSVDNAKRMLDSFLRGDYADGSERAMTGFGGNLVRLMINDCSFFEYVQKSNKPEFQRVMKKVKSELLQL